MKINIEFDCSYQAKMTIDGRELGVEMTPGITRLTGTKQPEIESTLGGMAASELYDKVGQIMQAWAAAEEEDYDVGTWDTLSDDAANAAYDRLM